MKSDCSKKQRSRRSLSFSKTLWLALISVLGMFLAFYFYFNHYTEADKQAYERLVSDEVVQNAGETQVSTQKRLGLQKDILTRKGERLRLTSGSSELALEKTGRRFAVVEKMKDVTCSHSGSDGQGMLMLHAKDASYDYEQEVVVSENIRLLYHPLVETSPQTTTMEGAASTIKISLGGKSLEAVLDHVEASFDLLSDRGTLSADAMVLQSMPGTKQVIQTITAEGSVVMRYGERLTAIADHAVFQRDCTAPSTEMLPGTLILNCLPDKSCCISSLDGDIVHSKDISIDTVQQSLSMQDPKGVLKSMSAADKPLKFAANKLTWKEISSQLVLSGQVIIAQDGLSFQGDHDVNLTLHTVNGKKSLLNIETEGESLLTYRDHEIYPTQAETEEQIVALNAFKVYPQGIYTLQAYGPLKIDHQRREVKLRSPESVEGIVEKGKQVHFRDSKGEMYADRVFMKYEEINQKLIPTRLVLQGNVKIATTIPLKDSMLQDKQKEEENQKGYQQYVLADRVDFIPQSKEMLVKAFPGKRVLLFDQTSNLEVSAPSLKLIRDRAMQKELIEGKGDVRFHFVDSECEQLRRHFSFEKTDKK